MQNNIKNLGAGIITAAIIFYLLIIHFSYIGLAGAVVCAGLAVVLAFAYRKNDLIVQKLDLYILLVYAAALIINYEAILQLFTRDYFDYSFRRADTMSWVFVVGGLVLWFILGLIAKSRKTPLARAIIKFLSYAAMGLGICLFFDMDLFRVAIPAVLISQIPFALITMCAGSSFSSKRPGRVGMIVMLITIALRVFVPGFRFSGLSLSAYASSTLLPWYMVLILSVLCLAIAGLSIFIRNEVIDADSVFFAGFAGLIWVIKASLYFYFAFSWVVIFIYLFIFAGFLNRFLKRSVTGSTTYVHSMMSNNEMYWVLIAAICSVVVVWFISRGYIYFALAAVIGAFVSAFLHRGAPGWIRSAVFWIVLVIAVAVAFAMLSLQSGAAAPKFMLIAGMAVFAAVIMWMMNHRNDIAHNQYTGVKILMTVLFAALLLIVALKAGSQTKITYSDPKSGSGGVVLSENAGIDWQVSADGKSNSVKNIEYVWSDGFTFDKKDVKKLTGASGSMNIENRHLIIWVEDSHGVVTRTDRWFDRSQQLK